jgi:hypothetical protein
MSATSAAAFIRIQPTARATRSKILDFATQRGPYGLTCDELAQVWACSPNHVAPRCTELVKSGQLVVTDRCRQTSSGNSARVLVVAKFASGAGVRAEPRSDCCNVAIMPPPKQSLFPELCGGQAPASGVRVHA